jgi:hypothetical protein
VAIVWALVIVALLVLDARARRSPHVDRWFTGTGLPTGTMGRIGLDVSRSNPNVIYALIEVAAAKEQSTAATAPRQSR